MFLIVILASNIWSTHGQNVNPQHDDAVDYVGAVGGGDDSDSVGGSISVERDIVPSSGEVMASRLPVLNENEPSCEELKAMWRYHNDLIELWMVPSIFVFVSFNVSLRHFNREMMENE